jgi:hypothetical protein
MKAPSRFRRILGAYLFRSETIVIDGDQPTGRRRFTEAHEIGHRILPWQRAAYYLDDSVQLFRETQEQFEDEASVAGAYLIFQGARFHARALDYADSLQTPLAMADDFAASLHATIRFYVEYHSEPIALAMTGLYVRRDGTVPIWSTIESPTFAARYGSFAEYLPPDAILIEPPLAHEVGLLVHAARGGSNVHEARVALQHPTRGMVAFDAETFCNRRTIFLLVRPHRKLRVGRRILIQTG